MKIYLPIEIKNRELDSRILLANKFIESGCEVVIGHKNFVNREALCDTGSIYLSKSCAQIDLPFIRQLKRRSFFVGVIDEEAVVHQNISAHIRSRLSSEALSLIDYYFAWGNYDSSVVIDNFPLASSKVIVSGNPRLDLLCKGCRHYYFDDVDDIVKSYGDYIIIPSSFGMCNHFTERGPRLQWRKSLGMIKNKADEQFYIEYFEHFNSIFLEFISTIRKLSIQFPGRNFIVRPHPSENQDTLLDAFQGLDNVHVVYDGPVAPWLMGSRMVIHNGCTTAIESILLDKHVVSYRPFVNDKYDLDLPNEVSTQVFNYADLASHVATSLAGKLDLSYNANSRLLLSKYILDSCAPNCHSFDVIASTLLSLGSSSFSFRDCYVSWLFSSFYRVYDIYWRLRSSLRVHLFARSSKSGYIRQKFDSLSSEELIQRFGRVSFGSHIDTL
ncbi:hypothetical protein OAK57_03155, partial [Synechococcus sp. AH-551-N23]|nr:hypothetical protein [Synechococcus sp. AH-551-N23]